jgi:hypothetical protein
MSTGATNYTEYDTWVNRATPLVLTVFEVSAFDSQQDRKGEQGSSSDEQIREDGRVSERVGDPHGTVSTGSGDDRLVVIHYLAIASKR